MGYTNVQNVWCRSRDEGRTWEGPTVFEPPLIGPSWELCSPILDTGDGRWLAPVSTWPSWHGDKEGDDRWECVAFVSPDEGATWPDFVTLYSGVMEDGTPCDDLIFWCAPDPTTTPATLSASTVNWDPLNRENKLIRLDESTLLNTAWTVEHASGTDRPVSYVLSRERPQP